MMKKLKIKAILLLSLILVTGFLATTDLRAEDQITEDVRRLVVLLPIKNPTNNEDYSDLSYTIYNAFESDLEKQESLEVIPITNDELSSVSPGSAGFKLLLDGLRERFMAETCIDSSYYIDGDVLHVSVNVIDLASKRIKNCFIETMPLDVTRTESIKEMSRKISASIARDLPAMEREALVQKQIALRLREKLDAEERLLNKILEKHNEILVCPLAGIHWGRSIISWSGNRPPLGLPIGLDYSFLVSDSWLLTAGFEYIPIDLMRNDTSRYELGASFLLGYRSRSTVSFGIATGLGITYDSNSSCSALSAGDAVTGPSKERISFSIPIRLQLDLSFDPTFFAAFTLDCYGLTYTIETADPGDYDRGSHTLKYYSGFSPLNFLCLSLTTRVGIRF